MASKANAARSKRKVEPEEPALSGWKAAQAAEGFYAIPFVAAEVGVHRSTIAAMADRKEILERRVGANRRLVNRNEVRVRFGLPPVE